MSAPTTTYTAQPRAEFGKTATKALRAKGLIPVSLSARGKETRHGAFDQATAHAFTSQVVHLCKVSFGGAPVTALRSEVAVDCLSDKVTHIDLVEVDEKSEIIVDVAINPIDRECPGVKAGGVVEQRLRTIKVKVKATDIPDKIDLDLSKVEIMQSVYAKSLTLPKGVKLVTPAHLPVLSVVIPRGMKVEEEKPADGTTAAPAAAAAAGAAAAPAAGAKPGDAKAADPKAKAAAPAKK